MAHSPDLAQSSAHADVFETSVVVLADAHNPTIMHPNFLRTHKIVPSSWQPIDETVVCSLAFSTVQYRNGISVLVEPNRLQIRHTQIPGDPEGSILPDIAIKYLRALPEVAYKAVGINISLFYPIGNPWEMLRQRFLKDGPWINSNIGPLHAGLTIGLDRQGFLATFRIEAGERDNLVPTTTGIFVRTNYHSNIDPTISCVDGACKLLHKYHDVVLDSTRFVTGVLLK